MGCENLQRHPEEDNTCTIPGPLKSCLGMLCNGEIMQSALKGLHQYGLQTE